MYARSRSPPNWVEGICTVPPAITLDPVHDYDSANRPLHTYTNHEQQEPVGWLERLRCPDGVQTITIESRDCLEKDKFTRREAREIFWGVDKVDVDQGCDVYIGNEKEPTIQIRKQVTAKIWGSDVARLHTDAVSTFRELADNYPPPPPKNDDERHKEEDMLLGPVSEVDQSDTKESNSGSADDERSSYGV